MHLIHTPLPQRDGVHRLIKSARFRHRARIYTQLVTGRSTAAEADPASPEEVEKVIRFRKSWNKEFLLF